MNVFGKCILAGEHAVVRGHRALVTPLFSRSLTLNWERSSKPDIEISGPLAEPFLLALQKAQETWALKNGWKFSLHSNIPPRAGLGSSAALSVAIAQFLVQEKIADEEIYSLGLELENLFHGKSSGIDVAAVLATAPIFFQAGKATPLESSWRPSLYLFDSGLRSPTKAAVEKVMKLARVDLDAQMEDSVAKLEVAFQREDLSLLAAAFEQASDCFKSWELIPQVMQEQMETLRKRGALAAKPTGSGDGGFILSVWEKTPPRDLGLIPVFSTSVDS